MRELTDFELKSINGGSALDRVTYLLFRAARAYYDAHERRAIAMGRS